jgi:hypothetical protein
MSAKIATKTANTCATIYDGRFNINFDCVGETVCKNALCQFMPPTGDDECSFRTFGSCTSPHAKIAAIKLLRDRLSKESKQIEESFEG